MLDVDSLTCAYGRVEVLHNVSLHVSAGEIVTLLGANGAGKTTLLRAISGLCPPRKGQIKLKGQRLDNISAHRRVALGVAQAPEGRQIFTNLSVEDNIRLGRWRTRSKSSSIDEVYEIFPVLAERKNQIAGGLSGGQQQMLAIGRALVSKPSILLLDEPSMGLSPLLIDQIFSTILTLKSKGITVLLVEQNVAGALAISDRGYVLEAGSISVSGPADQLLHDPKVISSYLGM
ncbi:ABC transporter ATP-binding protein [Bosea sp. F3-2]|uniref:ABC transporter ATP-binding protein n=1 Tax=Bosea sp. F3-2 TaxID=2599640 RepID=UPI0011EF3320|nr:ABC transporter ATP-binding protein [Bosea sp. F3-2]QEL22899.1 ABC transporter ATP-binding protein [Bosea sp. F3-2]